MTTVKQYYPYQSNSYYQTLTVPNGLARNLCFPPNCPIESFPMDYRKQDIDSMITRRTIGLTRFIENGRPLILYPFYPPVFDSF